MKGLFEPDCRDRQEVAVDETKIEIDGEEIYAWVAVDCDMLEVLAMNVSPSRSSLDALLFPKYVLERCCGRPQVRANCGPWYDWPLELLNCEDERET